MNSEVPPPNRAVGWCRMIIWLMPTSVAISCIFAIDGIHRWTSIKLDRAEGIAIGLTFLSAIVLGWIEPKFDRRWDGHSGRSSPTALIRFVLLQIIIVPVLLLGMIFGSGLILGP